MPPTIVSLEVEGSPDVRYLCCPTRHNQGQVRSRCQKHQGKFSVDTAKSILRAHQGHCMHGELETRGSQISSLTTQRCKHWLIDRPFPCRQEYKLIRVPTVKQDILSSR